MVEFLMFKLRSYCPTFFTPDLYPTELCQTVSEMSFFRLKNHDPF